MAGLRSVLNPPASRVTYTQIMRQCSGVVESIDTALCEDVASQGDTLRFSIFAYTDARC